MREQNFIPIIRTEVVTYRLKGSTVTLLEQKPAHHFAMRDRQSNFGFVGQLTDHPCTDSSPSPSLRKRSPRLTDFRVVAVLPASWSCAAKVVCGYQLPRNSLAQALHHRSLRKYSNVFSAMEAAGSSSQHHAVGFYSSLHVSFRKTGEMVFCGQDHHALLMRDIPTHKPAEDHRRCDALCFIQHTVFPLLLLVTTGCLLIRDPRIYLRQRSESACEF